LASRTWKALPTHLSEWGQLGQLCGKISRGSLKGPLFKKGHPDFAKIAKPWNLYYASTAPQGIAPCASANDVRSSLLWAASNSVPLAIRSGGHSYASFSTTSGLLIDVSLVNEVAIHDAEGLVRMGRRAQRRCHASHRPVNRAITHAAAWEWALPGWSSVEGLASARRHWSRPKSSRLRESWLSATTTRMQLGQLIGTEAELRALLAPLYRIGGPGEEIIRTLSYWDAQGILAEDENDQFTHERSRYAQIHSCGRFAHVPWFSAQVAGHPR
jgi:hypothetical protein